MPQQEIRLVVGLGNPGAHYAASRHNVGFRFVERVAEATGGIFHEERRFQGEVCKTAIEGMPCWLLKPLTYMNHSGRSVAAFSHYYRLTPEEMLVVHDELDLLPGTIRVKRGGGHAGHNGLRDLIKALGSADFHRLRIGIGHPQERSRVVDYVLSPPTREEAEAIQQAMEEALAVLPELLRGEIQRVMNRLHAR